jgi:hypothetical protein
MLSECANPDCRKEFDCHQGRFFRFHAVHDENGQPRNTQELSTSGCVAAARRLIRSITSKTAA